jgi:hypothetical protein
MPCSLEYNAMMEMGFFLYGFVFGMMKYYSYLLRPLRHSRYKCALVDFLSFALLACEPNRDSF